MSRKIKVLFVTRWYPDSYDPMPGLFIQRLATALTPWCDVVVVCVYPDPEGKRKNTEVDFYIENEVRVLRIYFRVSGEKAGALQKSLAFVNYYRVFRRALKSISGFQPDIIHGHIMTRVGVVAWRLSRQLKIPFVISEHWSRYFPENNTYQGLFRKFISRLVIRNASAVIAVSEPLMEAMKRHRLRNPNYQIIPNIVDTSCFKPALNPSGNAMLTVIHISCFDDRSKNISRFLEVVKKVREHRDDFRCLLVGEGPDLEALINYATTLGLHEPEVVFTGLLTGEKLETTLRNADLSVVMSNYETFGTVIIESLASGVPVLSTKVGIAGSVITAENGLVVDSSETGAFAEALTQMLDRCRNYDRAMVAASLGERFSPRMVGQAIVSIYKSLIPNHPSIS